MGRYSNGSITTLQAKRLELSYLLRNSLIKPNSIIHSSLSWKNNGSPNGSIRLISDTTNEVHFINLIYSYTDYNSVSRTDYNYPVQLEKVKSNLGKGFRYYFICPVTKKRCTKLYLAYHNPIFTHREGNRKRIYYDCQIESKGVRDYLYLRYENQVDDLYSRCVKSHYNGKPTKIHKRIEKIQAKIDQNLESRIKTLAKFQVKTKILE